MSEEWIEFTAMHENVEIKGYMNLDEADDEAPLCFYDHYGFEITHYPNNPFYDDDRNSNKKKKLSQWFQRTDIIQWLVDFAHEEKAVKFEDPTGTFYLYINRDPNYSSLHDDVEVDKSTTIRIKQSTKKMLDNIGWKNQSYDDIVQNLIIMNYKNEWDD